MKIELMREFVLVAGAKSLTRAAKGMYMSQSTLSSHIADMERELGFELFDRSQGERVRLSRAGAQFLETAQAMISLYDESTLRCRELARKAAPLKIGANTFTRQLMTIMRGIPEIEVELVKVEPKDLLLDGLAEGKVDANLSFDFSFSDQLTQAAKEHGIASIVVGSMDMAVAVMADHPLAQLRTITATDLEKYHVLNTVPELHPIWTDAIARILGDDVRLEVSLKPWLADEAEMMRQGLGDDYVIGFAKTMRDMTEMGDIVSIDQIDGRTLGMPLCMSFREQDFDWRYEALLARLQGITLSI
ncbi:LysR family transcriptional regulator [Adlercreutzia shanghongiae]|uniref:LysR family transcriptional regulator n=1 Tax=Adlercreutzia shanghongiae TaxID=3111773 RepID=A0ABU6IY74_9ACTN|nr:LysR family transcriptional regulator [Adlercreutzia sp. R22]MEC4294764.1 LysR family transcriptional regulator [Adlercreutzia sp. R22]